MLAEAMTRLLFSDRIVLFPRYHAAATYGQYRIRRMRPSTEFWHTSVEGSWKFTINGQGFRDNHEYTYEKSPGTVRVVALGDSQTTGFEVRQERTYSAVIERYLNRQGIKAEVLNTGVSGFSTAEALVFLEKEGVKYEPDFVVLGFYANDLQDNIKSGLFRLERDRLVPHRVEHIPGVWILNLHNNFMLSRWLSENSYFYSALINTVWETKKRLLYSRVVADLQTEYTIPVDKITDYQIQLAGRLIQRMYALCRSRQIGLIIVDIPQIHGENFKSSVPPSLQREMAANSDVFLSSESVLGAYRGIADFFVPHGQRHISEFSHLTLGIAVSRAILSRMEDSPERSAGAGRQLLDKKTQLEWKERGDWRQEFQLD